MEKIVAYNVCLGYLSLFFIWYWLAFMSWQVCICVYIFTELTSHSMANYNISAWDSPVFWDFCSSELFFLLNLIVQTFICLQMCFLPTRHSFFSYYLRLTGWNQRKEGFELIDKFITRDVLIIMARELTWHVYDSRHSPGSWREHCSSELMSATCLQNGLQSLETLISLGTQH